MSKVPGQLVALAALIASVINAQCAVSCSLQVIPGRRSSQVTALDSGRAGHSCCAHKGVPNQRQQKDETPCPYPAPSADQARIESIASFSPALAWIAVLPTHQDPPLPAEIYLDPLPTPDSSGLSPLSSISILRI